MKVTLVRNSNGEVLWEGDDMHAADRWHDLWLESIENQGKDTNSEEYRVTFEITTPQGEQYAHFQENMDLIMAGCLNVNKFLCHLARWLESKTHTAADFEQKKIPLAKAFMVLEEAAGVQNWSHFQE